MQKARIATWGLLVALVVAGPAASADQRTRDYVLFNGSTRSASAQDTSEYASAWIAVKGASRIVIRTWSTGAATDTAYADSITTFKMLFSDSICCMVTGPEGTTIASAADSIVINGAAAADTTKMAVAAFAPLPINKALKASVNGSGIHTMIAPLSPGLLTVDPTSTAVINKKYMRVRVLPLIRMTTAGFSSTAGIRTSGVRGLKMIATVIYARP